MAQLTDSNKIQGLGTPGVPTGNVVTVQDSQALNALTQFEGTGGLRAWPTQSVMLGSIGGANDLKFIRIPNIFKSLSTVTITAETTIWTPAAGKKFRLMGYAVTQGVVTGAITLRDGVAGIIILVIPQNTIGVVQISPPMGNGILSAAVNNVLTATGVATETITGYVFGTEE